MIIKLDGRWRKASHEPCAALYPAEIEFQGARYLGRKGSDQGFITLDAGTFHVVGPHEIQMTTATDSLVSYRYERSGETLTLTDPDGCTFSYRRLA